MYIKNAKTYCMGILATILFSPVYTFGSSIIEVNKLTSAPLVDGKANDWGAAPIQRIALKPTKEGSDSFVPYLDLRSGYIDGKVYFFVRWPDTTQDLQHKPYVWNESIGRYEKGSAREDRLAMQFEISGDYSTNWASGNAFIADMWHWKSSRSEPLGLAHDKSTIISKEKMLKSYKLPLPDGGAVYIRRPSDTGDKLYQTKRYAKKEKDVMPKYFLPKKAEGSIADVKTSAVWLDGFWQLEIERSFNTGNDDDVVFTLGEAVKGGLAVFNHSENEDHSISNTLLFQF